MGWYLQQGKSRENMLHTAVFTRVIRDALTQLRDTAAAISDRIN